MDTTIEIKINGVLYNDCAVLPFMFDNILDATLDSATIELERLPMPVIVLLSDVEVSLVSKNGRKTTSWIVDDDASYETPIGSGLYHHSLSLIEETKYLEGFIVDSLCVTHPGGNVYVLNAKPVEPVET